jgi:hypothetical protein
VSARHLHAAACPLLAVAVATAAVVTVAAGVAAGCRGAGTSQDVTIYKIIASASIVLAALLLFITTVQVHS